MSFPVRNLFFKLNEFKGVLSDDDVKVLAKYNALKETPFDVFVKLSDLYAYAVHIESKEVVIRASTLSASYLFN